MYEIFFIIALSERRKPKLDMSKSQICEFSVWASKIKCVFVSTVEQNYTFCDGIDSVEEMSLEIDDLFVNKRNKDIMSGKNHFSVGMIWRPVETFSFLL